MHSHLVFLAIVFLIKDIDAIVIEKRIVNGRASTRGQWPWLVSLNMLRMKTGSNFHEEHPTLRDTSQTRLNDDQKLHNSLKRLLAQIQIEASSATFPENKKIQLAESVLKVLSLRSNNRHVPTFEGHMCSGSLINDRWVLSAKHCFSKLANANLTDDPLRWSAEIGEFSLSGIDGHERSHRISKIIVRDPVDSINFNDLALLKLADKVQFSEFVQPLELSNPMDFYPPGESCSVAGWGHTSYGGEMTDEIHHVEVPLISDDECVQKSPILLLESPGPGPGELCAGGGREDACQYDSGGPLVCRHQNSFKQLGIVSRGEGCGDGYPGIYTDVRDHLDWILATLATE